MATLQSFFILSLQNHTFSDMRQSWMVLSEIEPVISWNNKKDDFPGTVTSSKKIAMLPWWCRVSGNSRSNHLGKDGPNESQQVSQHGTIAVFQHGTGKLGSFHWQSA